ncbi:hypothetical protein LXA43DRAFT_174962 [Ganoderma leucocontextum]|nr:hypothetical protein LXA43DRAFT_174962 [Ganoderma leucocontextum]
MHKVLFPLNDTIVVFFHRDDTQTPMSHVAQITVKTDRPHAIDTITTYYLVRHDLSDLILRLVTTHLEQPVQDDLVFEGLRYTIHARRSPWSFGQRVVFAGETRGWKPQLELEACSKDAGREQQ